MLDLNTLFKISTNSLSSGLANETVILNHKQGAYYGLNEVGTAIWEHLSNEPKSLTTLKSLITEEFEIDDATCEADLKSVLSEMLEEKLIEIVE